MAEDVTGILNEKGDYHKANIFTRFSKMGVHEKAFGEH